MILEQLGIEMFNTLHEWARKKDVETARRRLYTQKSEIKRKRSIKKRETYNSELKFSKICNNDEANYESGIGINDLLSSGIINNTVETLHMQIDSTKEKQAKRKGMP